MKNPNTVFEDMIQGVLNASEAQNREQKLCDCPPGFCEVENDAQFQTKLDEVSGALNEDVIDFIIDEEERIADKMMIAQLGTIVQNVTEITGMYTALVSELLKD